MSEAQVTDTDQQRILWECLMQQRQLDAVEEPRELWEGNSSSSSVSTGQHTVFEIGSATRRSSSVNDIAGQFSRWNPPACS